MKATSYLLPALLAPSAAVAAQAKVVSEPLTTDSLSLTVSNTNPGGPILTFTSHSVTDTTSATESASATTTDSSLSSESTTTTALHPSEPTGVSGVSGGTGTGTSTGTGASASATTTASEGAAFWDGGSSRVALVVALGAGLLGWVAF
ncbi:hypothetical protein FJTKL_13634 [Diaporthe vaccinii]|uniref:Uncharacterized protein n=1 Tax=Diaporthe vaccinii TaxID=105482 RepID=A0ABR4EA06_9PEZI